jgi:leader peptidase (prepilin peptidase) / N-methyltransferase
MLLLFFFILGLVLGSFYLVVGMRLPKNESIIKPRSHCEYCHHELNWYELIPVLSYLFLRGKCLNCHHHLSCIYPFTELATGLLFCLGYYLYGLSYNLYAYLILISILILIFISDFKYLIILDMPIIIGVISIFALKFYYFGFIALEKSFISSIFLFLFMLLIKKFGDIAFKKESLGGGDIKLALFIGAILGIRLGFINLIIGSIIALPFAFIYIRQKKQEEIPFGPFLILGTFLCFVFMEPLSSLINYLFLY